MTRDTSSSGTNWRTGERVSTLQLPRVPTPCPKTCIYATEGMCDEPRINKGNGDAYCHKRNNKDVLAWLNEAKQKAANL
jgi:hypothetical protein